GQRRHAPAELDGDREIRGLTCDGCGARRDDEHNGRLASGYRAINACVLRRSERETPDHCQGNPSYAKGFLKIERYGLTFLEPHEPQSGRWHSRDRNINI